MSKEVETLKVQDIENNDNTAILDVPDYVYISETGKVFYPYPTKLAKVKILLEDAYDKKLKPSKVYQMFVEKLYKEQKNKAAD